MIEENDIRIQAIRKRLDLIELTDTDEIFRVGGPDSCGQLAGNLRSGRERQRIKLIIIFVIRRRVDPHMHEDNAFATLGSIKQLKIRRQAESDPRCGEKGR